MNPSPHAEEEPRALRILRALALALLCLGVALLAALAVAAYSPGVHAALAAVCQRGPGELPKGTVAYLAAFGIVQLLVAAVLFWSGVRLGWDSWLRLAAGACLVLAAFAYLAHDDPVVRRPPSLERVGPSFPGADASFEVLMRYSNNTRLGSSFRAPDYPGGYPKLDGHDPRERWETLLSHRAAIEANWKALAPERAWWHELNAYDRIGDLTRASRDSPLVSFQVLRTMTQHADAVAGIEAVEGRGDQAVETLLPILQVSMKLQPYSRTLVRSMMAVVMERLSIETAAFVLDTAKVSPGSRARLEEVLREGYPGVDIRHLYDCSYSFQMGLEPPVTAGTFVAEGSAAAAHPAVARALNRIGPIVYHPRATANLYGVFCEDISALAEHRDLAGLRARTERFLSVDTRPRMANLVGLEMLKDMAPAFTKVTENFWRTEDSRAAFLARLEAGR